MVKEAYMPVHGCCAAVECGARWTTLREAASAFAGPAPSAPKMPRRGPGKDRGEVPETKRKVIQAALRAGVKPTQVAKHFGVSLVTLRQIGSAGE